jgi:hypothetical protein
MGRMSTRLARLAARLDALARAPADEPGICRIVQRDGSLAIPLPDPVVAALGLREGDELAFAGLDAGALTIAFSRRQRPPG